MEKLEMLISPTVHAAAFTADEVEAKRLCKEMWKLWNAGHSFIIDPDDSIATFNRMAGLELRQSDSAEEVDAAVNQLQTQLAALAIRKTIARMSREECAALVHALDALDLSAKIQALGQELQACEILSVWNEQHPTDKIIRQNPSLEN